MKTQNLLTTVRLMTYTMILGLFVFSASVYATEDDSYVTGGGEETATTEQIERIELENWMLEEEHFTVESNVQTNTTESHPLESWMIEGDFELKSNSINEQLPLEDWMLERSNFKITENNSLESWMMNRRCFITKEERNFESIKDWMINRDFFRI